MKYPTKRKDGSFLAFYEEKYIEQFDFALPLTKNEKVWLTKDGQKIVSKKSVGLEIVFDEETNKIVMPDHGAEAITIQDAAVFGFVNLHISDEEDFKGDGKWYSLTASAKTQHKHDPVISRAQAKATGVELGGEK